MKCLVVLNSDGIKAHETLTVWTVHSQIFVASLGSESQFGALHVRVSTWITINPL